MNKNLEIGIDELTVVLQFKKDKITDSGSWKYVAENAIYEVVEKAKMHEVLGKAIRSDSLPNGYVVGYEFTKNPYYLRIAYHDFQPSMGLIIKFSASAWEYYCESYNRVYDIKMNAQIFIRDIQSDQYKTRLSRIDFFSDYFNYDIDLNEIYQYLNDDQSTIILKNKNNRKNTSKLEARQSGKNIQTIYVGARNKNYKLLLRIYDKKAEQLQTNGIKKDIALNHDNWIRFEVTFKNEYSHQITEILLKEIKEESDLQSLIAEKITEKYVFYDTEKEEPITISEDLLNIITSEHSYLSTSSVRDSELLNSLEYIISNSGLMTILFKIQQIWSDYEVIAFLDFILLHFLNYHDATADSIYWLNKYKILYKNMKFSDLLNEIKIKEDK